MPGDEERESKESFFASDINAFIYEGLLKSIELILLFGAQYSIASCTVCTLCIRDIYVYKLAVFGPQHGRTGRQYL